MEIDRLAQKKQPHNAWWIILGVIVTLLANASLVVLHLWMGGFGIIGQYVLFFLAVASLIGASLIFSLNGKKRVIGGFLLISPWIYIYLMMFISNSIEFFSGINQL